MTSVNEIHRLLSTKYGEDRIDKLLISYLSAKEAYLLRKWDYVIMKSAIFSETIVGILAERELGINVDFNSINFNQLFMELMNSPKPDSRSEILLYAIPQVAKSIYAIRNKKSVAHLKEIDPNMIDAIYCIAAADWILSQLLIIGIEDRDYEEEDVVNFITRIGLTKFPLIDKFEDGTVYFPTTKNLKLKDMILILLYLHYPDRLKVDELAYSLRNYADRTKISKEIYRLHKTQKLIHKDEEKRVTLTLKGLSYVEESLLPKLSEIIHGR